MNEAPLPITTKTVDCLADEQTKRECVEGEGEVLGGWRREEAVDGGWGRWWILSLVTGACRVDAESQDEVWGRADGKQGSGV